MMGYDFDAQKCHVCQSPSQRTMEREYVIGSWEAPTI